MEVLYNFACKNKVKYGRAISTNNNDLRVLNEHDIYNYNQNLYKNYIRAGTFTVENSIG